SCELAVGDPVFAANRDGSLQQVGLIARLSAQEESTDCLAGGRTAQAVLFSSSPDLGLPLQAYYYSAPDSIEWVVRTLLPVERRRQIEDELMASFQEHHEEILKALQPAVNKSVREALTVLEQDLPAVLDKHWPELQAIAGKDKEEILKRELFPLVKSEIWPIVRNDSEPLVRQMSTELWERVSLWSFAWRGTVDRLPLLRGKNRLEEELRRFLDQEAAPILERHQEDFLGVIEHIVRDVADNDKVNAALKRGLAKVAEDPGLQRQMNDMVHEVVLE